MVKSIGKANLLGSDDENDGGFITKVLLSFLGIRSAKVVLDSWVGESVKVTFPNAVSYIGTLSSVSPDEVILAGVEEGFYRGRRSLGRWYTLEHDKVAISLIQNTPRDICLLQL